MAYNRWMPIQYDSELYHYGVKGMKWGHHLKSAGQAVYDAAGGAQEREVDELAENMDWSDPDKVNEYWDKNGKFVKTPVGRIRSIQNGRLTDLFNDIVYDDRHKGIRQKGKLAVKLILDYIKNG